MARKQWTAFLLLFNMDSGLLKFAFSFEVLFSYNNTACNLHGILGVHPASNLLVDVVFLVNELLFILFSCRH